MIDFDERLRNWSGLPYIWAALHWLSMSHSCYNPVIYCWMNVRFRTGFIIAFGRLPCFRRFIHNRGRHTYNTSTGGVPLTGKKNQKNQKENTTRNISLSFFLFTFRSRRIRSFCSTAKKYMHDLHQC